MAKKKSLKDSLSPYLKEMAIQTEIDGLKYRIEELEQELEWKKEKIQKLSKYNTQLEKFILELVQHKKEGKLLWNVEQLNDEKLAFYCIGLNLLTGKIEEYEIERGFNPHDKKRIKTDSKGNYNIKYKVGGKEKEITLPIPLFKKLKDIVKPKKDSDIPELRTLMIGEEKNVTPIMESVWNVLRESKGNKIWRSTQEIADMVGKPRQTVYNHLKTFMSKKWITEKRRRYMLVDTKKF